MMINAKIDETDIAILMNYRRMAKSRKSIWQKKSNGHH